MNDTQSPEDLRQRTRKFASRIIRLYQALPHTGEAHVIGTQLLRSATSVGANYRSACRGRSRAEFASKLGIVVEEADETIYWLELLEENEIVPAKRLTELLQEAHELTAIFTAARQTTRNN
ncbi:MAG: four helix bundle protein [Terriglobales bacterium]